MTIVLATIPLMLVAVAIATVPLIAAMRRERREQLARRTGAPTPMRTAEALRPQDLPVAA